MNGQAIRQQRLHIEAQIADREDHLRQLHEQARFHFVIQHGQVISDQLGPNQPEIDALEMQLGQLRRQLLQLRAQCDHDRASDWSATDELGFHCPDCGQSL